MIVYAEAGLEGLELWRGISRYGSLHQLRHRKDEYFRGLREFLIALHAGRAESPEARETIALRGACGFDRVIFVGGEASHPLLAETLGATQLPFAYEIPHTGPFAGQRGAHRIFAKMGWASGLALDLGQTQLKVMTAAQGRLIPRDESMLPFGADSLDAPTARARLLGFVGQALSQGADGVVLGLPVEISPDGIARPSTYPGLFGPIEPVFCAIFPMPWIVVNDAVLAAVGFRPSQPEKRLVVTLGFGIGGALWNTK